MQLTLWIPCWRGLQREDASHEKIEGLVAPASRRLSRGHLALGDGDRSEANEQAPQRNRAA